MARVMAPLFSLSATGTFGKALFYYDTKFGARVRSPKKSFVPPGNIWEVNKEWFRLASERVKTLDSWQKKAWKMVYEAACDTWRDIFMGQQIALWNLSPENMLTWPPKDVPEFTPPVIQDILTGSDGIVFRVQPVTWSQVFPNIVCFVGFRVSDNARVPIYSDFKFCSQYNLMEIPWDFGHVNYIWGGWICDNGRLDLTFVGSYNK